MQVTTRLYDPETDSEYKVELSIHYTEFRKGDSVAAYHGPTPDEEAEVLLEEVFLDGVSLETDHPLFLLADDEDYLWSFVEAELEEYETAKYEYYLEQRERI